MELDAIINQAQSQIDAAQDAATLDQVRVESKRLTKLNRLFSKLFLLKVSFYALKSLTRS